MAHGSPVGWRCRRARRRGPAFPAVIWVHGGPVGQARPNYFAPDIQMLLAQGFAVVLLPNSAWQLRLWPCQHGER